VAGAIVTPGFAQPRSKLPWLPYESLDRVIINSHNFTPAGPDFSVNGKSPVGAWCPSRDDAGNGTTTLTDLANDYDGTLINFALTGSTSNWVAETGAGGVRAIASDGSNDYVSIPTVPITAGVVSVSGWYYRSGFPSNFNAPILCKGSLNGDATSTFALYWNQTLGFSWFIVDTGGTFRVIRSNTFSGTGSWVHVVGVASSAGLLLYLNGSLASSGTGGTLKSTSHVLHAWGTFGLGVNAFHNGLLDDIRLFPVLLDATDVADLYASGAGRGVQL
jgi:hypothetical protein